MVLSLTVVRMRRGMVEGWTTTWGGGREGPLEISPELEEIRMEEGLGWGWCSVPGGGPSKENFPPPGPLLTESGEEEELVWEILRAGEFCR